MTICRSLAAIFCAAIMAPGLLPLSSAQADEAMKTKIMASCEAMMKGNTMMKGERADLMKADLMKKCETLKGGGMMLTLI